MLHETHQECSGCSGNVLFLVDWSNLQVGFMPWVPISHPWAQAGTEIFPIFPSTSSLRHPGRSLQTRNSRGLTMDLFISDWKPDFSQSHLHFFLQERAAKATNSFSSCSCAGGNQDEVFWLIYSKQTKPKEKRKKPNQPKPNRAARGCLEYK